MAMAAKRLETVVEHLASRPGHETVRTLLAEMCVNALDIPQGDVEFEIRIPEVRGRIDGLFGSTVFEFKRDLRRETDDAEEQLTRYLAEELKQHNIAVNCIKPNGPVATPTFLSVAGADKDKFDWKSPDEMLEACTFLANQDGSGVTGMVATDTELCQRYKIT